MCWGDWWEIYLWAINAEDRPFHSDLIQHKAHYCFGQKMACRPPRYKVWTSPLSDQWYVVVERAVVIILLWYDWGWKGYCIFPGIKPGPPAWKVRCYWNTYIVAIITGSINGTPGDLSSLLFSTPWLVHHDAHNEPDRTTPDSDLHCISCWSFSCCQTFDKFCF